MKGPALLALLLVMVVGAMVPGIHGLEADVVPAGEDGTHLRHLSDELEALPETEDALAENDEDRGWRGGGGGWHGGGGGGCYRGSRFWPRCKFRRLEEEPAEAEEISDEMVEAERRGWYGGDRNCFPGSRFWPRCRDGGRDCFPGSRFWPRCRHF